MNQNEIPEVKITQFWQWIDNLNKADDEWNVWKSLTVFGNAVLYIGKYNIFFILLFEKRSVSNEKFAKY